MEIILNQLRDRPYNDIDYRDNTKGKINYL